MRELEFIGEYDAPATAANELVRAATGFAFDLIAERVRTNFDVDPDKHTASESFEIKLRNHRKTPCGDSRRRNAGSLARLGD
jgi:hypothetical protein